jgi:hypothetical protein
MTVVTMKAKKGSRPARKVTLAKATASEILAAVKVSPDEERRAKSAVAAIRKTSRVSGSVKRLSRSASKRHAAPKLRLEAK